MKKPLILLIEDDDDIRELIVELLQDEGYSIQTAVNGTDALEFLKGPELPQLILLDLMLPDLSGNEVVDRIRAEFGKEVSDIPILITSAAGEVAEDLGNTVSGYVKKPIQISELLDAISSQLSRGR